MWPASNIVLRATRQGLPLLSVSRLRLECCRLPWEHTGGKAVPQFGEGWPNNNGEYLTMAVQCDFSTTLLFLSPVTPSSSHGLFSYSLNVLITLGFLTALPALMLSPKKKSICLFSHITHCTANVSSPERPLLCYRKYLPFCS